jgi:CDP-2,3-bis-(O-geranylgeranyl)-sn-glycerol synthase
MSEINLLLDLLLLLLLLVANGSPIGARAVLGKRMDWPIDGGLHLGDGRPLFGRSKTLRGILTAMATTPLVAHLLGMDWRIGLLIGTLAMTGDLLSSFIKRRIGLPAGARATGLDHLPESVLPLLACAPLLDLGPANVALVALTFMLTDMLLSRWLHRLGIGRHPH